MRRIACCRALPYALTLFIEYEGDEPKRKEGRKEGNGCSLVCHPGPAGVGGLGPRIRELSLSRVRDQRDKRNVHVGTRPGTLVFWFWRKPYETGLAYVFNGLKKTYSAKSCSCGRRIYGVIAEAYVHTAELITWSEYDLTLVPRDTLKNRVLNVFF